MAFSSGAKSSEITSPVANRFLSHRSVIVIQLTPNSVSGVSITDIPSRVKAGDILDGVAVSGINLTDPLSLAVLQRLRFNPEYVYQEQSDSYALN
ncbi:TPA: hypothetical protein ACTYY4_003568 [Enterobacter hormaechei]